VHGAESGRREQQSGAEGERGFAGRLGQPNAARAVVAEKTLRYKCLNWSYYKKPSPLGEHQNGATSILGRSDSKTWPMSIWCPNALSSFLLPALTFKFQALHCSLPSPTANIRLLAPGTFHEAPLRHGDGGGPVAWGGGADAGAAAGAGAPPGAKGGGRADAAAVDAESD